MITIDSVSSGYVTIQATNQQASAGMITIDSVSSGYVTIQATNQQASAIIESSSLVIGPTGEASILISN
jgi:hypothetical protein